MKVTFSDKKLKRLAENGRKRVKELGFIRAKLFRQRIDDMEAVDNLQEAKCLPGHYHELSADRKGQWACDLDQPYRLIFVPHDIPLDEDGTGHCQWVEITAVEIIEIVNYHNK